MIIWNIAKINVEPQGRFHALGLVRRLEVQERMSERRRLIKEWNREQVL